MRHLDSRFPRSPAASETAAPLSRVILQTPTLRVGTFRAHPADPRFAESGQPLRHLFVFPRSSVWIEHPGRAPFVADPTLVTYYNRGARYRRRQLAPEGDRCEWFAFEPAVLMDVVAHFEPAVVERPDEPFPFSHGPSDAASYARQREVVQAIAAGAEPEPLQVEETMLRVLAQVLARAYAAHGFRPPRRPRSPGHAVEIAARVQSFVAGRLGERLTLARLGRAVASSPFELCRLFRSATGWTLHAYVLELRLRAALERVAESRSDLSAVAQDFGFASHAHFTSAFRTRFGLTPSTFRSTASGSRLRAAAK